MRFWLKLVLHSSCPCGGIVLLFLLKFVDMSSGRERERVSVRVRGRVRLIVRVRVRVRW